jgi:hypothetical protein
VKEILEPLSTILKASRETQLGSTKLSPVFQIGGQSKDELDSWLNVMAQIPRDMEAFGLGVFVYQMSKGADSLDQPRFGTAETLHEAEVVLQAATDSAKKKGDMEPVMLYISDGYACLHKIILSKINTTDANNLPNKFFDFLSQESKRVSLDTDVVVKIILARLISMHAQLMTTQAAEQRFK